MAKAVFVRRGDAFHPVDQDGRDILLSVPEGKEVMGEFSPKRNIGQHRLFFALLNILVENDVFDSIEAAIVAIKIATGEVDTFVMHDGPRGYQATTRVCYVPRSIDFASMDQARFRRFFDRAIHIILTKYLQGSDEGMLRQQVLDMVDSPKTASLGRRIR